MSTLRVNNITDATGGSASLNVPGTAKAWVNFNGTNGTIRGSLNVTSVTRNTTGTYTVNITNALSSANYAVTATCSTDSLTCSYTNLSGTTGSATTTAVGIVTFNSSAAAADRTTISVAIHN